MGGCIAELTLDALPCRIRIHAEGFEAFLYNRTPAYDEIVKRMQKHEAEASAGKDGAKASEASSTSDHHGLRNRTSIKRDQTKGSSGESSDGESMLNQRSARRSLPDFNSPPSRTDAPVNGKDELDKALGVDYFRELCPMEVSIKQGSVILGNDATPSVLIAHFVSAKGTLNSIDVSHVMPSKYTTLIHSPARPAICAKTSTICGSKKSIS